MSAIIVGSVFVDVKGFAFYDYIPTGTNIGSIAITHGGVSRNVSENFAVQGEPCTFVSVVEDSGIGHDVVDRLTKLGVDTRYVAQAPNGMGMWLALLDKSGELVGSVSRQPDFVPMLDNLKKHLSDILISCDSVILEIDTTEDIAEYVLDMAAKFKKPVFTLVGNMGVIMKRRDLLGRLSGFICNEIEASRLLERDVTGLGPDEMLPVLSELMDRYSIPSMVITMGGRGSVYNDGRTQGHCPALPTDMVDSTGAGDAFFSGAVMALTRGMRMADAVKVGTRMASATLSCAESNCGKLENLFCKE